MDQNQQNAAPTVNVAQFIEKCQASFDRYLTHAVATLNGDDFVYTDGGMRVPVDTNFLQTVESAHRSGRGCSGCCENATRWRTEIFVSAIAWKRENPDNNGPLPYTCAPGIRRCIEQSVLRNTEGDEARKEVLDWLQTS